METQTKFKLTHEQRETIVRMRVNGTPILRLAEQFKVSRPLFIASSQKAVYIIKKMNFISKKTKKIKKPWTLFQLSVLQHHNKLTF